MKVDSAHAATHRIQLNKHTRPASQYYDRRNPKLISASGFARPPFSTLRLQTKYATGVLQPIATTTSQRNHDLLPAPYPPTMVKKRERL